MASWSHVSPASSRPTRFETHSAPLFESLRHGSIRSSTCTSNNCPCHGWRDSIVACPFIVEKSRKFFKMAALWPTLRITRTLGKVGSRTNRMMMRYTRQKENVENVFALPQFFVYFSPTTQKHPQPSRPRLISWPTP